MTEFLNIKIGSIDAGEISRMDARLFGHTLESIGKEKIASAEQTGDPIAKEFAERTKNLGHQFIRAANDSPPDSTD